MTPETAFAYANQIALLGWVVLAVGVVWRPALLRDIIAGQVIPALLATLYTALIVVFWAQTKGDFFTLAGIGALFAQPWILLAGWVHYLAFDLFIGAWIARDAAARGLPRGLMIAVLPLTFVFGPIGLLAWLGLRTAFAARG